MTEVFSRRSLFSSETFTPFKTSNQIWSQAMWLTLALLLSLSWLNTSKSLWTHLNKDAGWRSLTTKRYQWLDIWNLWNRKCFQWNVFKCKMTDHFKFTSNLSISTFHRTRTFLNSETLNSLHCLFCLLSTYFFTVKWSKRPSNISKLWVINWTYQ